MGDRFTSLGAPTILYEAGHNSLDYDQFCKKMIFNALITGLIAIDNGDYLNYSNNITKSQRTKKIM